MWGWPFALTVHAFGTAIVIGFIFIINLRLIGFFRTIPFSSLNRLFPVIWIAFVFQFLSGFIVVDDEADAISHRRCVPDQVLAGYYRNRCDRVLLQYYEARSRRMGSSGERLFAWRQVRRRTLAGMVRRSRRRTTDRLPRDALCGLTENPECAHILSRAVMATFSGQVAEVVEFPANFGAKSP